MENPGVCQEPTSFYLLAIALRSFFLVLATHLLAGAVDTTLSCSEPLTRRLSWWCRYYNPLNLSWRYYSMFAYRFVAHSWGSHQLALINHEEHPFLCPLPYIVGEMAVPGLRVRRLEMAGLLSSQGILTFSAAYQGILAVQYAISTEGIPYLPNVTVPLAMVGLFRVMGSKWVATKIQVDAYPHPCARVSPALQGAEEGKSNMHPSLMSLRVFNSSEDASRTKPPIIKLPELSPSSPQWRISPLIPMLSRPYSLLVSPPHASGILPLVIEHVGATDLVPSRSSQTYSASPCQVRILPSSLLSSDMSQGSSTHAVPPCAKSSTFSNLRSAITSCSCACGTMHSSSPPDYTSNKYLVALWIFVLCALVIMSFLPYKVAASYQLPLRLLPCSMQFFYQYVAVSEFIFHAYLLFKGPWALANRVLFFDHWAFKAQTVGFYCLLTVMLVISLIDFVKHGYYRSCA